MVMLLTYGGAGGTYDFNLDIDVTNLPSRREALEEICRPVPGVHGFAKRIAPENVAKAFDNEPFEDYPRADFAWQRVCHEAGEKKDRFNQSFRKAIDGFLRRVYYTLNSIPGISFNIEKPVVEKEERKALDAAIDSYWAANLGGQVDAINEAYDGLRALRTVFGEVSQRNCASVETVIPSRYLPELLMAAPVWFVEAKEENVIRRRGPDSSIVRYFCDRCATLRFAHLFQMYNYSPRGFDEFTGRDVMPLSIVKLVEQVRGLFDFLVIATPYHDLASGEWQSPGWIRNIDPFLFGFLKQIPELMFFLGRWSGTGLFPLMGDMIADTIEHIRKNKALLRNFSSTTSWYRAPIVGGDLKTHQWLGSFLGEDRHTTKVLVEFADNMLNEFEYGSLFPWLREEGK